MCEFSSFLLLLISSFISSWLGKILSVISDFLNVLRLVLWPNVWSILEKCSLCTWKGNLNLWVYPFFFYHFAQQLGTTSQPYYIHWRLCWSCPIDPHAVGRNAQGTYWGQDYLGAPQTFPSRVSVGAETKVLYCVMTARHASATTIRELWKKIFITHKS